MVAPCDCRSKALLWLSQGFVNFNATAIVVLRIDMNNTNILVCDIIRLQMRGRSSVSGCELVLTRTGAARCS